MHSKNIMHRDLKPENLAFTFENRLKIIDLGSAKVMVTSVTNSTEVCTLLYRAPELLMNNSTYNCKIDVWAAACIICETLSSTPIFLEVDSRLMLLKIVEFLGTPPPNLSLSLSKTQYKELRNVTSKPDVEKNLKSKISRLNDKNSKDLLNFILSTLKYDDRVSASQALELPYISKILDKEMNKDEMNCDNDIINYDLGRTHQNSSRKCRD